MIDRLSMASALVERARVRAAWIGDDHGDPYEEAILSGIVSNDIQISVKEALDHLRAALDYCARQLWEKYSGTPRSAKIYFPISWPGKDREAFSQLVKVKMPGVAEASHEAFDLLASVQEFTNPANAWLSELGTLTNLAKHDHLEVASVPSRTLQLSEGIMRFKNGDAPKRSLPWMLMKPVAGRSDEFDVRFLQFKHINVELSHFLSEAISGVDRIVHACRALIDAG